MAWNVLWCKQILEWELFFLSQDVNLNFTAGLPTRSSPGANTLTERFPPSLLKQWWQAVSEERIISPEMEPVCLLSSWCASRHFFLQVLHESQCQLQINNRTPKSPFKAPPVNPHTVNLSEITSAKEKELSLILCGCLFECLLFRLSFSRHKCINCNRNTYIWRELLYRGKWAPSGVWVFDSMADVVIAFCATMISNGTLAKPLTPDVFSFPDLCNPLERCHTFQVS